MQEQIRPAATPADYAAFAQLVSSYLDWCRSRYADLGWFVEEVFSHQSLGDELKLLATAYGPPRGKTLLASLDGEICGAGAYRKIDAGICEMKRLFVPDRFRGRGLGKKLSQALIAAARAEGFTLMRLDTADRLQEAIALYESMGFRRCAPYHSYPAHLMPHLVFMELSL